jgi:hypothetical protein
MPLDFEQALSEALALRGNVTPAEVAALRAELLMQHDYSGEYVAFVESMNQSPDHDPVAVRTVITHHRDLAQLQDELNRDDVLKRLGVAREQVRVTRCP